MEKYKISMKKKRIHTTLSEEAYRILQKFEGEAGGKNAVLEKALHNLDKTRYKAKISLRSFISTIRRIESGTPGFDNLIEGGIPEGSVVVITGPPGTGKTTFSLQFLKRGAELKEKGLYFSFEEDAEQLVQQCFRFGWNLSKYVEDGIIEIFGFSLLTSEEIADILESYNPKRVVFDSINIFSNMQDFRKSSSWRAVLKTLKKNKITSFMITEKQYGLEAKRFDNFDFMGDGLVFMDRVVSEKEDIFLIAVKKMRGTKIDGRPKLFRFSEKGIEVSDISPIGFTIFKVG